MLVGYTRISTDDEALSSQRIALVAAGCERVVEEVASSRHSNWPELVHLLDELRANDLVVARLDRLARSSRELLQITVRIGRTEAGLRSLQGPWADTSGASGRVIQGVLAGLAAFERALLREHTASG